MKNVIVGNSLVKFRAPSAPELVPGFFQLLEAAVQHFLVVFSPFFFVYCGELRKERSLWVGLLLDVSGFGKGPRRSSTSRWP
uniref:Uncharacterized protein n=1 Tax=Physcomitrium patens TaxID=3218 RepID=A0A2K1KNK3_PHYPA|nr:hypothetical protein PHYPA_006256 [Physcomitrium patens]